ALLATAAHSLVDFNFYVPAILVLMGVELAWLHQILWQDRPLLRPFAALGFTVEGYRSILVALVLLPVTYFAAIAWSDHEYQAAVAAGRRADWVGAERLLMRSERLFPGSDTIRTTRGDLARQLLRYLPRASDVARARVYAEARDNFRSAHKRNPLRPQPLRLLGELEEQHPHLAGAGAEVRALRHFQAALALDPRDFRARFDLMELLLHRHHPRLAAAVGEAGIHYWYAPVPAVLPYLGLTAVLRAQRHDTAGAARLRSRIAGIEQAFPKSQRGRRMRLLGTTSLHAWGGP
ncbi:MAG TPA: hypothetical protein VFN52_06455, partial [Acidiferrobacteraceae bacterium]|nr:hypothetical protein [Acidiferrobacteraceae bacterium]